MAYEVPFVACMTMPFSGSVSGDNEYKHRDFNFAPVERIYIQYDNYGREVERICFSWDSDSKMFSLYPDNTVEYYEYQD